jgi:ribosome modulation factor
MTERDMQFADYPLLNTPHLTLIVMKAAVTPGATLGDALARLKDALEMAREEPPFDDATLRTQLEDVAKELARLGFLQTGRQLRMTHRGREILAKYPRGFNFADVADPLQAPKATDRRRSATTDPRRHAFQDGYDAHHRGKSLIDNPYLQDSVNHLAWEDGWSQARDDAARPYAAGNPSVASS